VILGAPRGNERESAIGSRICECSRGPVSVFIDSPRPPSFPSWAAGEHFLCVDPSNVCDRNLVSGALGQEVLPWVMLG
jgi:hypothetical protein